MKFLLEVACDNAAFEGDPVPELSRLLDEAATKLNNGEGQGRLLDINGNTVGSFRLVGR